MVTSLPVNASLSVPPKNTLIDSAFLRQCAAVRTYWFEMRLPVHAV